MKAVGIKTLKAKLSEYVRLAKAGETILITEREDVVAELRPARRQSREADDWMDALDALAERAEAQLRSTDAPWRGMKTVSLPPGSTSQKLLDELRGEAADE